MTQALIALGSNLGDRQEFLHVAVDRILSHPQIHSPVLSNTYETLPEGNLDQPLFLNAVLSVQTDLALEDFFQILRSTEDHLGRVRLGQNSSRVIDLDLLSFGDLVSHDPRLTLPHPRLEKREFVLSPLAEVAPHWRHPVLGKTSRELLEGLPSLPNEERQVWLFVNDSKETLSK